MLRRMNSKTQERRVLNPSTTQASRNTPMISTMIRVTVSNLVSVTNISETKIRPLSLPPSCQGQAGVDVN